ncbi:MAG: hypothetical protein M1831_003504 [Alyxoria varia]|nr:MAG: hypothetical protein M1831_003504 [Alyxoria varia]
MSFAQLVIGPPGSGKSTYCDGMQQFLTGIERPNAVVNLDPANDRTSYPAALDVRDLVSLDEIMEAEELGPNGGILYALEELEGNIEWLEEGLQGLGGSYPDSIRTRLVVIHLVDSYSLTLPTNYISSLLLSLRSMLQMDLPHLNVLTKIDNLASFSPLPLPLAFYTEAHSLDYLLPFLDAEQRGKEIAPTNPGPDPSSPAATSTVDESRDHMQNPPSDTQPQNNKFTALNSAILDLIEDFSLVGFETLCVEDRTSMSQLLRTIDRASGYVFGGAEGADSQTVWQLAVREGGGTGTMEVRDVEERWVTRRAEFDEMERNAWEEEGKVEKERAKGRDPTAAGGGRREEPRIERKRAKGGGSAAGDGGGPAGGEGSDKSRSTPGTYLPGAGIQVMRKGQQ